MSRGGAELFVLTDQRHPLEVEAGLLPDVLECLLHHIIFHRALTGKAVVPKDMVLLDDLFYVKCGDERMDKQVSDCAVSACKALKARDRGGPVTLTFYERIAGGLLGEKMVGADGSPGQALHTMWYSARSDTLSPVPPTFHSRQVGPWEEWSVHIVVRTEPAFGHREEQLRRKELEGRMRELLWTVQKLVNSHRDHLPKEVAYCVANCREQLGLNEPLSASPYIQRNFHPQPLTPNASCQFSIFQGLNDSSVTCYPFDIKDPSKTGGGMFSGVFPRHLWACPGGAFLCLWVVRCLVPSFLRQILDGI